MTPRELAHALVQAGDVEAVARLVEQAPWPQPDRVLNRAVAILVGWGRRSPSQAGRKHPEWFHPDDCHDGVPVLDSLHGTDVWRDPLDYLGSLDAARTLVPQGWDWVAGQAGTRGAATVSVMPSELDCYTGNRMPAPAHSANGNAANAASALCVAALRARMLANAT